MSGSGRRRSSKWDLREDNAPENLHDGTRPSRGGDSFHDRQSRESLSGRRGFHRNESTQDGTMAGWDKDKSHATRLSPEGRMRQNRSRSPRSSSWARSYRSRSRSRSRSKSRSRSPVRHFRRGSEFDDQYRGRSSISAQICREFAAGRCRRGSSCSFIHDGSPNIGSRRNAESNATDSWEGRHRKDGASRYSTDGWRDHVVSERPTLLCKDFLKGNCRWGASCKYPHHDAANDCPRKLPARDVCRADDYEQRSRDEYSSRRYDREPSKSSNTLCKYFSAGNCRSGKHCRYSHQGQEAVDPERSVNESYNSMGSADKVWNGPKWSDTEPVAVQLHGWGEDKKMETANAATAGWTGNDSCNQNFADNNQAWGATAVGDSVVNDEKHLPDQWKMRTAVCDIGVSELKGSEKCHNDSGMQDPSVNVESKAPLSQFPYFGEQGVTEDAAQATVAEVFDGHCLERNRTLGKGADGIYQGPDDNVVGGHASSMLNLNAASSIFPAEAIFQKGQILNAQPAASLNSMGQSQPTFPSHPPHPPHPPQVPTLHDWSFHGGKPNNGQYDGNIYESQVTSGPAPGQSSALSDQLAQFSQLSTTLAQLLENSQKHRPQQYAAIPSVTAMDSGVATSMAQIPPGSVVSSQPIYVTETIKQYDPICDSFESKVPEASNKLPKDVDQSSSVHRTLDTEALPGVPASSVNGAQMNVDKSQNVGHPVHGENGGTITKGKTETEENGPVEDIAAADDGNKGKEMKEVRPFKFALAEFVKELLNPAWKEGQVSREAFKTIVKKVVEKVVDTMQAAHIPQSKEKIDHYLSDSKPKLSKLVQAYVEKYQKG